MSVTVDLPLVEKDFIRDLWKIDLNTLPFGIDRSIGELYIHQGYIFAYKCMYLRGF